MQCLNDFGIPLHLGHVVSRIAGRDRVEAVESRRSRTAGPDLSQAFRLDCDTVLLSVGLVPENELSIAAGVAINGDTGGPFVDADLQTGVPGVFACGNVLHVHDLVDFVSEEAGAAAQRSRTYLEGEAGGGPALGAGAQVLKAWARAPTSATSCRTPGSRGGENVLFFRPMVVKNGALMEVRSTVRLCAAGAWQHVQPSEMIRLPLRPDELPRPDPERPNVMEVSIA